MATGVGLFGGSFNPVHYGHLIVARAVAERLDLSRVLFLPAAGPPHKPVNDLLEAHHRVAMVRLAVEGDGLLACDEFDASRLAPCYTIDTVAHFRATLGTAVELCWIIGADSLSELGTWHRAAELVDMCRIVTARRGDIPRHDLTRLRDTLSEIQISRLQADILATPIIEISSTDIRRRVREGRSIRYLTPNAVYEYIQRNRLYPP